MKRYTFDAKVFTTLSVYAVSEVEARAIAFNILEWTTVNAGQDQDGNPLLLELSVDGDLDLVEIDGEPT